MLRLSNHLALTVMTLSICACSIYRSPDRNNFDNDPFTGAPPASAQVMTVEKSLIPASVESAHCLLVTPFEKVLDYKSTVNLTFSSPRHAMGVLRENGRARLEIARATDDSGEDGILCRFEFSNVDAFDRDHEDNLTAAEEMVIKLVQSHKSPIR